MDTKNQMFRHVIALRLQRFEVIHFNFQRDERRVEPLF